MNDFKNALNEAINSWSKLSGEWDKIEELHSDILSEKYPFQKDFRDVLRDLFEWREYINSKEE